IQQTRIDDASRTRCLQSRDLPHHSGGGRRDHIGRIRGKGRIRGYLTEEVEEIVRAALDEYERLRIDDIAMRRKIGIDLRSDRAARGHLHWHGTDTRDGLHHDSAVRRVLFDPGTAFRVREPAELEDLAAVADDAELDLPIGR